ncbi:hypothetical protein CsSME_00006129 [Camellia sinensis var. sinensis]
MTVFSWRVKGCLRSPDLSRNLVHVLTKKNPKSPAETLREGIIPVVRFSFITMKVKRIPSTKLTTKALRVSWFCHDGTSLDSNTCSTDSFSSSCSPIFTFFLSRFRSENETTPLSSAFSALPVLDLSIVFVNVVVNADMWVCKL